jgi:hypothetical protein
MSAYLDLNQRLALIRRVLLPPELYAVIGQRGWNRPSDPRFPKPVLI